MTVVETAARVRAPRPLLPVVGRLAVRALLYATVAAGAIVFFLPMAWMITTSFKPERDVFEFPPNLIPSVLHPETYPSALASFDLLPGLHNTMIIVIGTEVGRLLSASLAAFAFARLRIPYRNALFMLVLSTMMLPYHVTLIPQYLLFRDLGWLDTFLPLIVPSFFGGGAFFIFLLRQFFMTIPREYDDAAKIDGCTPLGIYWRIILPMSLPALGAVAIFTFMGEWNDFFAPLVYLTSQENYTLALKFKLWEQGGAVVGNRDPHPYNEIMAMATIITLPPILVFFFAQRYFIQGVVISGIKG